MAKEPKPNATSPSSSRRPTPDGANGAGGASARTKRAYDESAIQTLDALEHIRLRTGMYIGRIGDGSHPSDGVYVLIKEVIDNSIDEFIMGHGKKIDITKEGDEITVRDYGRGIPWERSWSVSVRSTPVVSTTTTSFSSRSA